MSLCMTCNVCYLLLGVNEGFGRKKVGPTQFLNPRPRPRPLLIYLLSVLYQASYYLSHNLQNSFSQRSPIAKVFRNVYIAIGFFELKLIFCPLLLLCCQGIKKLLDRGGGLLDKKQPHFLLPGSWKPLSKDDVWALMHQRATKHLTGKHPSLKISASGSTIETNIPHGRIDRH